jgi:hypothetical protein
MSAHRHELRFAVVVADSDHWTAEHVAAAQADPGDGYSDWVAGHVEAQMRAAGNRFIAEHPDLFALPELL